MWNGYVGSVEVISLSSQFINLLVSYKKICWLLSVVYANPKDQVH